MATGTPKLDRCPGYRFIRCPNLTSDRRACQSCRRGFSIGSKRIRIWDPEANPESKTTLKLSTSLAWAGRHSKKRLLVFPDVLYANQEKMKIFAPAEGSTYCDAANRIRFRWSDTLMAFYHKVFLILIVFRSSANQPYVAKELKKDVGKKEGGIEGGEKEIMTYLNDYNDRFFMNCLHVGH